jgi:hypothetical protein
MQYLNMPTAVFHAPEFLLASPTERGIWIALVAHCVQQENDGIIADCADWEDMVWMQLCGTNAARIRGKSHLWRFVGTSLAIANYNTYTVSNTRTNRRNPASAQNGKLGGRPRKNPPENEKTGNLPEKT